MKHRFSVAIAFAAISLAVAALVLGCRQNDQRVPRASDSDKTTGLQRDARDHAATTADTFAEQKQKAEAKMSSELNDLDARMADLKAKAQSAGDKAKAEWEVQRPKLEAQRAEAAKKFEELKASTRETWDEVSRKTQAAFGELEKGFKDAWARLKE
jgi:hypothetical protein